MTIPWTTALYLLKKVMPVLIDKAPDLLKSLERRRTAPIPTETTEPTVSLLQERLHAQVQTLAAQMDSIQRLEAAVRTAKRSLKIAWTLVLSILILCGVILFLLLKQF